MPLFPYLDEDATRAMGLKTAGMMPGVVEDQRQKPPEQPPANGLATAAGSKGMSPQATARVRVGQLLVQDATHDITRERPEHDDAIEAIAQLGRERAQLVHDGLEVARRIALHEHAVPIAVRRSRVVRGRRQQVQQRATAFDVPQEAELALRPALLAAFVVMIRPSVAAAAADHAVWFAVNRPRTIWNG